MNMYPTITVTLRIPMLGKTFCKEIQFSDAVFRDLIHPLPRGHDCPIDLLSMRLGAEQREKRREGAEHLGKLLAEAIVNCSKELDTIDGYERDEFRKMMDPNPMCRNRERFRMAYEDVPKMRSIYPFLEGSTKEEVIMLLQETVHKAPDDAEFAMACRLELMWRSKQEERKP